MLYWGYNYCTWFNQTHYVQKECPVDNEVDTCMLHKRVGINRTLWIWSIVQGIGVSEKSGPWI